MDLDRNFSELSASVQKLLTQVDNINANIADEQRMIRERSSTSFGMLWNGEPVNWIQQTRSLMQDAEGHKRIQYLKTLSDIAANLAAALNRNRLKAGLKILQRAKPEMVNDDMIELIANTA